MEGAGEEGGRVEKEVRLADMKISFLAWVLVVWFCCMSLSHAQTNAVKVTLDEQSYDLLKAATEDSWFRKDVLGSTVLGAVLAIVSGVAANYFSHRWDAKKAQIEENEFRLNLLRAIRCELEVAGNLFDNGIGKHIQQLKENEILFAKLFLSQDWFVVFNTNAAHFGKLNGDISRRIITVYAMMKELIEYLRINNEYLDRRDDLQRNSSDLTTRMQQGNLDRWMIDHAKRIKSVTAQLKAETEVVYDILDKQGIK